MNCPEPLSCGHQWLTREHHADSPLSATPPILKSKTDGGYGHEDQLPPPRLSVG
jgi:hypothetical protein